MKKVNDYLNSAFAGLPDTALARKFKTGLVEQTAARADELTARGLRDDNVLCDLIIGEHPDIPGEFQKLVESERKKKRAANFVKFNLLGTVLYSLVVVCAFLAVLFCTDIKHSWLILEGGFSLLAIYYSAIAINRLSKRKSIFHPVSRFLLAVCVMLAATFVFLVLLLVFGVKYSFLAFIIGAVLMLAADELYAYFSGQRFLLTFVLLYLPIQTALVYVALCIPGILPWHPGWLIILLSVIADVAIVLAKLIINSRDEAETEAEE